MTPQIGRLLLIASVLLTLVYIASYNVSKAVLVYGNDTAIWHLLLGILIGAGMMIFIFVLFIHEMADKSVKRVIYEFRQMREWRKKIKNLTYEQARGPDVMTIETPNHEKVDLSFGAVENEEFFERELDPTVDIELKDLDALEDLVTEELVEATLDQPEIVLEEKPKEKKSIGSIAPPRKFS